MNRSLYIVPPAQLTLRRQAIPSYTRYLKSNPFSTVWIIQTDFMSYNGRNNTDGIKTFGVTILYKKVFIEAWATLIYNMLGTVYIENKNHYQYSQLIIRTIKRTDIIHSKGETES